MADGNGFWCVNISLPNLNEFHRTVGSGRPLIALRCLLLMQVTSSYKQWLKYLCKHVLLIRHICLLYLHNLYVPFLYLGGWLHRLN